MGDLLIFPVERTQAAVSSSALFPAGGRELDFLQVMQQIDAVLRDPENAARNVVDLAAYRAGRFDPARSERGIGSGR